MSATIAPRKLTLRISAILLGVVGVAALAVFAGNRLGVALGVPTAGPTVTVTAVAPTPDREPIARDNPSALGAALPDASGAFVLWAYNQPTAAQGAASMKISEAEVLDAAGGAYEATIDGRQAFILVTALQYATAQQAQAAGNVMPIESAKVVETGEVMVGDRQVGSFTRYEATATEAEAFSAGQVFDPAGIVVWTNGTVRLFAIGPAQQMQNFYLGFSL
ncbi:hypothetical protein V5R04_10990 [Jonesiaceae bacterium BS-20]|uniref:Uncharacterized protein n=1 Tax=Jonesiaceae bacterium BS-20 TaxID=3120821 RepID=A0AAU7DUK1_9MICO